MVFLLLLLLVMVFLLLVLVLLVVVAICIALTWEGRRLSLLVAAPSPRATIDALVALVVTEVTPVATPA
jgi:multidrug efflux pump subunit AcrB